MARTIAQIQQSMIDQKNAESGLSGLTSTSSVAIWNLIFYICAVAIKVIEDLYDVLEADVEERKLEIPVGVLQWYAAESLVFQYGDSLVYTNTYIDEDGVTIELKGSTLVYPIVDLDKRVVDLAAANIINGQTQIKAAKVTAGVAAPLSAGELTSFTQYWVEKRFAGTSIVIVSRAPDLLKAEYTITYDPQVLDNTGTLLSDGVTKPIEVAVDAFLQTFQTVDFDGTMRVMSLTDAIQGATGVINAVATNVEARPDGGVFADILAVAQQIYVSDAGYMKIDPAFPLSGTLTFIPG